MFAGFLRNIIGKIAMIVIPRIISPDLMNESRIYIIETIFVKKILTYNAIISRIIRNSPDTLS